MYVENVNMAVVHSQLPLFQLVTVQLPTPKYLALAAIVNRDLLDLPEHLEIMEKMVLMVMMVLMEKMDVTQLF